ncbi:hypothetical protein NAL32_16925 [Chryseobacterium sp. Ch-15]|uniref:Uncharacterized protein n=1 Tax=Chryseobacterium muglaense TaxID=2893752 RepID=A0A9Q3UTT6_9FLAO|nr:MULTISPECIES: hypothetical protein [Chryseobacterium]MBD3906371.1 hypothetical protein [Chryseobacterium muglaense]MBO6184436.1 hypothetical protein [Chryseobacterium sp.]MCC9033600.1 hypothetical protein [Chryseobacterium muglaense]MCM2556070.1 hypothetical protein [Chryseobacterium muglaense]
MQKRNSSFTVIGLLFVGIAMTLVQDNIYLKYGFLIVGTAFLFYSIFTLIKKK